MALIVALLLLIVGESSHILANNISPQRGTSTTIILTSSIVNCDQNARKIPGTQRCVCNQGYTGSGTSCTDINECNNGTHPCHQYAVCQNTKGGFKCSCRTGFAGNGFTCIDNDECAVEPCLSSANCNNTLGSYRCTCKAGFSGDGTSCTDINECQGVNKCSHGCVNNIGSYTCTCPSGYRLEGQFTCADVDECSDSTNNCHQHASCTNEIGTFSCSCKGGYLGNGTYCQEDRFVPYAKNSFLRFSDDGCKFLKVKEGIPIDTKLYKNFFVCTNGQVSFGRRQGYIPSTPLGSRFRSYYRMLAVFWSDIDLGLSTFVGGNRLYYGLFRDGDSQGDTTAILTKGNAIVNSYLVRPGRKRRSIVATYAAKLALVATWYKVTPYKSKHHYYNGEVVTFQLVLLSDGTTSYAIYIYEDDGMRWLESWMKVMVGYSLSRTKQRSLDVEVPSGKAPFAFDAVQGNTGKNGIWVFNVGEVPSNTDVLCYEWFRKQPSQMIINMAIRSRQLDCPPSLAQANMDRTFRISSRRSTSDGLMNCYIRTSAVFLLFPWLSGFQQCCYDERTFSLFTGIDPQSGPLTTIFVGAFLQFSIMRQQLIRSTTTALRDCCITSDLCDEYVEKRPIAHGEIYRPPQRGFGIGDPHIRTLDGKAYTFNGLGDYVLLQVSNHTSNFSCHSRTGKAPVNETDGASNSVATVFTGFAFSSSNRPKIEIYLNLTTQNVTFFINETRYYLEEFKTIREVNGTDIEYVTKNGTMVVIDFQNGIVAEVSINKAYMATTFTVAEDFFNKTVGLLGVYNNDVSDEFTTPDGTILDVNSTEEQIYYQFGEKWKKSPQESLFLLPGTNDVFTPVFFNDVDSLFGNNTDFKAQAIQICGGRENRECLFDAYVTRDFSIAAQTTSGKRNFQEQETVLNNFPPKITGPSPLVVTFKNTYTFQIIAVFNRTAPQLEYSVRSNNTLVTVNQTTGIFSLNVTQYQNMSLQYIVTDKISTLSRTFTPILRICYCLNGGVCDFTKNNELSNMNTPFLSNYACNCSGAYEGAFCETFVDPCESSPCFPNVTCTADPATGNRICGACPPKYSGDGEKCVDINECLDPKTCQHRCTNFLGGFNCSCFTGYEAINSTSCVDQNECNYLPSVCHDNATCTNYPGGHNCSCNNGFIGNGANCTDIDECASNICHQFCNNTVGSFSCSCRDGYELRNNSKTHCQDIDECKRNINDCDSNADCYNSVGSYLCFCKQGFSGDGKTCVSLETSSYILQTTSSKTLSISVPSLAPSSYIALSTHIQVSPMFQLTPTVATGILTSKIERISLSPVVPTAIVSSVSIDVCETNPCKNAATCTKQNGVPVCQCRSFFYGTFCTETRKHVEGTLTIFNLLIGGKSIDFSDNNIRNDLVLTGSSLYNEVKSTLETELTLITKAAISSVERVIIKEMRLGSLIVDYYLVLSNNYNGTTAKVISDVNATLSGLNYSISSSRINAVIVPSSVNGKDFDECQVKVCSSNAVCLNKDLSFTCSCKTGYSGDGFSCNKNKSDSLTVTITVSVVAGALLFLIIFLAIIYGMKKKRIIRIERRDPVMPEEGSDFPWTFVNSRLRASRM